MIEIIETIDFSFYSTDVGGSFRSVRLASCAATAASQLSAEGRGAIARYNAAVLVR